MTNAGRCGREWLLALGSFSSMELEITDDARALLEKRGGAMTIDFIKPTG